MIGNFLWKSTVVPVRGFRSSSVNVAKRWKDKSVAAFQGELRNPIHEIMGEEHYAYEAKELKGKIYDKKPCKVKVEKYMEYVWCGCGLSRHQPFCDDFCENKYNKAIMYQKPGKITYIAPEDKEVWFCNCKQSSHKPFCDGTHQNEEIQSMRLDIKFEIWDPRPNDNKRNKK